MAGALWGASPRLSPDALEVESDSLPAGSHLPPALCKAYLETTFSVIARFFYFKVIIYPSPRICKGDFGRNSPLFCFPKSARGKNFSVKSFSCTLDSFFKPQKGRGPFAPPANIISLESDCRRQRRCRCCESSRP